MADKKINFEDFFVISRIENGQTIFKHKVPADHIKRVRWDLPLEWHKDRHKVLFAIDKKTGDLLQKKL